MTETYFIEAKTVEEAIAIANRKYSDDKHEVSTEIISLPKKGFFGIGAKDAKIKVTVTESQSAELNSLVSDIKKMKTLTDRGNDRPRQSSMKTRTETQKPGFDSGKPKKQQSQPKKQTLPSSSTSSAQTQQSTAQAKQAPKPKQPQPKQTQQNTPQQKSEPARQSQPKPTTPSAKPAQTQPKQAQPTQQQSQPQPQTQTQPSQPQTPQKTENHGSLSNQVKSKSRRMSMNRTTPAKEIDPSGVTVSSPIGVESFTAHPAETTAPSGFGSFGTESDSGFGSGRMSNDIRKKPRQSTAPVTDPSKANLDALKALTSVTAAQTAAQAQQKPQPQQPSQPESKPVRPQAASSTQQKTNRNQKRKPRQPQPQTQPQKSVLQTQSTSPAPESTFVAPPERIRECVTQEEMDFALDFANTLLANMKLDAKAVQAEPDGDEILEAKSEGDANVYPKINIVGGDTGILIGHHGETLDSIQYLVNLSASRRSKQKDGDYVKIVVDIEGYREKREKTLRSLARRMASRAVKYKRNIYLEPMNAYERRIIHSELQTFENVSTHSVGSDRDRKIVITYEGPDKRSYQKRERKLYPAQDPEDPFESAEPTESLESVDPVYTHAQPELAVESAEKVEPETNEITEKTDKTEKEDFTRPNKPKKLPIEKLDSLLETRESSPTAPVTAIEAEAAVEAVEEEAENDEVEAETGVEDAETAPSTAEEASTQESNE